MRKKHLHLVVSRGNTLKQNTIISYWEKFKNMVECLCLSKNEKIYLIKDSLIKIYKDYEETTGIVDIPYFVRADIRMSQIIQDRKVNYYYIRLKKFKNAR